MCGKDVRQRCVAKMCGKDVWQRCVAMPKDDDLSF
jgi:hypothetical protein